MKRQSSTKKGKNNVAVEDFYPQELERKMAPLIPEDAGASVEPEVETSKIPTHKTFQRTLSPADVLHVHSYAKGDYVEEALFKEEENSENCDESKKDFSHVSKDVSSSHTLVLSWDVCVRQQAISDVCFFFWPITLNVVT